MQELQKLGIVRELPGQKRDLLYAYDTYLSAYWKAPNRPKLRTADIARGVTIPIATGRGLLAWATSGR
jgi:hypothetical protein